MLRYGKASRTDEAALLALLPASSPPAAQLDGVVSERRPLLFRRRHCDFLGWWKRLSWKHGRKPCQRHVLVTCWDVEGGFSLLSYRYDNSRAFIPTSSEEYLSLTSCHRAWVLVFRWFMFLYQGSWGHLGIKHAEQRRHLYRVWCIPRVESVSLASTATPHRVPKRGEWAPKRLGEGVKWLT